jgi:fructokinase
MVSAVGEDALGERALGSLRALGVRCDHVARDPAHPTGRVLVTLDAAGQPQYEIEQNTAWDHLAWTDELARFAARCDAVCFGSLGQRSPVSRATIRRFLEALPPHALRVFDVNLRQRFYDRDVIEASLALASAVKLNDEELPIVAELCGIESGAPRAAVGAVIRRYGLRIAALTRGPRGALLFGEEVDDECSAPRSTAVDTVGAGDSFTATMVMGVLHGLPLDRINRHANAVASFVCSQAGATPAIPDALRTFA